MFSISSLYVFFPLSSMSPPALLFSLPSGEPGDQQPARLVVVFSP
ncbi:hypothetical protein CSUI_008423 [Cystoisospora suis]|uniref:Uncharacterized protein n=1 Tax=Cystoisospora suis TaxID=483139 RepID=A0A2C6KMA3_9APIC|nr:hypothetical protein CSUI_008423 [Cystoisospora suis]